MSKSPPPPSTELSVEEKTRAIDAGAAWGDDYIDRHGPTIEGLQRDMAEHALAQLLLALGPRYGREAVSRVLEVIISSVREDDEGENIRRRIREGDISLIDHWSVDIDWPDLSAEIAHLFAFARYGYGRGVHPIKPDNRLGWLTAVR